MQETIQAELQAAHEQQKIEKAEWAADGDLLRANPNYEPQEGEEDEEEEDDEEDEDDEEERAEEERRQQEAVERVKKALLEKERAKAKAAAQDAGSEDEVEELVAGMAGTTL